MEYAGSTDLEKYLRKGGGTLLTPRTCDLFGQVATGIAYIHGQFIAHLDVKPANIMLNANGDLKIIDFGLAVRTDGGCKEQGPRGTMPFLAPEMFLQAEYFASVADAFSMGVLLLDIVCGINALPRFMGWHDRRRACRKNSNEMAGYLCTPERLFESLSSFLDKHSGQELPPASFLEVLWGMLQCPMLRWSSQQVAGSNWLAQ